VHKAHLRQHSNSCLLDAEAAECSQLLEISMPKPATNDGHSTNSPIITNRFHWKVTLIMPMTDAQETGTRKTGNGFWYVWHTILHWFFLYQILVLGCNLSLMGWKHDDWDQLVMCRHTVRRQTSKHSYVWGTARRKKNKTKTTKDLAHGSLRSTRHGFNVQRE